MNVRLYNQTLSHRFGTELLALLAEPEWQTFDFAVAWVRRSGMKRVQDSLRTFLARGGTVRGTVGVDIENTSVEGLRDLLALASAGDATFWVYHNENPRSTFHPKLYLLSTSDTAALIVGSNNITEAGLYTNTEAGLRIDGRPVDTVIRDAKNMLAVWREESSPVIRPLSDQLIKGLQSAGYILSESTLRARRERARLPDGRIPSERLFGSILISVPPLDRRSTIPNQSEAGSVLLMRVRRASETTRRTQIQVPIRLTRTGFFQGVTHVKSRLNGELHLLRPARARGGVNTIKLELPEIDSVDDPVVRFERPPSGELIYNVYDATSPEGQQIMSEMRGGLRSISNPTVLTLPDNPGKSTWYRFV